jgi:hypothetical protein
VKHHPTPNEIYFQIGLSCWKPIAKCPLLQRCSSLQSVRPNRKQIVAKCPLLQNVGSKCQKCCKVSIIAQIHSSSCNFMFCYLKIYFTIFKLRFWWESTHIENRTSCWRPNKHAIDNLKSYIHTYIHTHPPGIFPILRSLVYVRHQGPLAGVELTTFGLRDTTATVGPQDEDKDIIRHVIVRSLSRRSDQRHQVSIKTMKPEPNSQAITYQGHGGTLVHQRPSTLLSQQSWHNGYISTSDGLGCSVL